MHEYMINTNIYMHMHKYMYMYIYTYMHIQYNIPGSFPFHIDPSEATFALLSRVGRSIALVSES
jgi:hypothetical protein